MDSLSKVLREKRISNLVNAADTAWLKAADHLCNAYFQAQNFDSLRMLSTQALRVVEQLRGKKTLRPVASKLDFFALRFYRFRGISNHQASDYANGLKDFQQYLVYAEILGKVTDIGNAYTFMAYCHRDMEDYKNAYLLALKAQKALAGADAKSAVAHTYTVLAAYHKNYTLIEDSIYHYCQKAIALYKQDNNPVNAVNTTIDLIIFFLEYQKIDSAQHYLNQIKPFIIEQEIPGQLIRYYILQGEVLFLQGKNKEALSILVLAEPLAKEMNNPLATSTLYRLLAMAMAANGQYRESCKTIRMAFDAYGIDVNNEKARQVNTAQLNFEFERKEAAALLRLQEQKRYRDLALVGLVLGCLLTFLMYRLYILAKRNTAILREKNAEIERSFLVLKEMQDQLVSTEKQREAQSIRVKIARDIHDELGSGLTKITLLTFLATKKLNKNQSEVNDILSRVIENSKNVSASLNEIVWAVNPSYDTAEGLTNYLRQYCHRFLMDTGIDYSLKFPDEAPAITINPEVKRNIFLVLKEALNNIVKYANADAIKVDFSLQQDEYAMVIQDNGIGFSLTEAIGTGNGLSNMKSRIEHIGGNLSISASPGKGCAIAISGHMLN